MKRALFATLFVWSSQLALLAQEGAGAHGGEAGGGWMAKLWGVPTIVWQIGNILLVVALFVFLLKRPAPQFFRGRAKEIQDLLEKALRDKEDALARLGDVEKKMAQLGDEVAAIEKAAADAAELDRQRVQAEADSSRERIRKEAAQEMERHVNDARRELRVYAADLAVKMAKELAAGSITEEDEKGLQARFLNLMERGDRERLG